MPPKGRGRRRPNRTSQHVSGLQFLSQRAKELSIQLKNGTYLCCICMEKVKQHDEIVSCSHCYNAFHLSCMTQWFEKSEHASGCPSCRCDYFFINEYRCFCGKTQKPSFDPYLIPHSCGDLCGRARELCEHRCRQQCHPGPCVECGEVVSKSCPCGSTVYTFVCSEGDLHKVCGGVCNRALHCGKHRCQQTCHEGRCAACTVSVEQQCACGKRRGTVACGEVFACGLPCDKLLSCGVHRCQRVCHSGPCPLCPTDPQAVKTCPCGALALTGVRTKCTDAIPTCNLVCGRRLSCGRHACVEKCHAGPCGPCTHSVTVQCHCGRSKKLVPCTGANGYSCDRVCGTRLSCGRHYCQNRCCTGKSDSNAVVHVCFERCNHKLPCGHLCGEPCHRGPCPPCIHVSSEPITCFCGRLSLPPPQPCGMEHPSCGFPCETVPPCGHAQLLHCCHFGPCPPCVALVPKPCVGGHCLDVLAPCSCSPEDVRCDSKCGKLLSCGHLCARGCHGGACLAEGQVCRQACGKPHAACGHLCKTPCHANQPCPECKEKIKLSCRCEHITKRYTCAKVREMQSDSPNGLYLPCEDVCFHAQRLNALRSVCKPVAKAPDPIYSVSLWELATTNQQFIQSLEEKFHSFCASAETLLSLPPCNREKRSIIHMLSRFYHMKSYSVDIEPKRNCVVTKTPNSAVPTLLLSAAVCKDEASPLAFVKKFQQSDGCTLLLDGEGTSEASVGNILFDFVGTYVYYSVDEGAATLLFPSRVALEKTLFFLRTAPRPFHYQEKSVH